MRRDDKRVLCARIFGNLGELERFTSRFGARAGHDGYVVEACFVEDLAGEGDDALAVCVSVGEGLDGGCGL